MHGHSPFIPIKKNNISNIAKVVHDISTKKVNYYAVIDKNSNINHVKTNDIIGCTTNLALLEYIQTQILIKLIPLANKGISDLLLDRNTNVKSVNWNDCTVKEAFEILQDDTILALALLNNNNRLIDTISASDVAYLYDEEIEIFEQPVKIFVEKYHEYIKSDVRYRRNSISILNNDNNKTSRSGRRNSITTLNDVEKMQRIRTRRGSMPSITSPLSSKISEAEKLNNIVIDEVVCHLLNHQKK